MSDYLSEDELCDSTLPEGDVDLSRGKVRVRALTRAEVLKIKSQVKSEADAIKRQAEIERKMLASALVAPKTTYEAAGRWQEASTAGEIDLVTNKIQELSGMLDGAAKEAYQEFDRDSETEFRLPPSAEARHDRG